MHELDAVLTIAHQGGEYSRRTVKRDAHRRPRIVLDCVVDLQQGAFNVVAIDDGLIPYAKQQLA